MQADIRPNAEGTPGGMPSQGNALDEEPHQPAGFSFAIPYDSAGTWLSDLQGCHLRRFSDPKDWRELADGLGLGVGAQVPVMGLDHLDAGMSELGGDVDQRNTTVD